MYEGTIITNGDYDKKTGNEAISNGNAQLVSYGRLFIANPDLPKRFMVTAELNQANPKTFYGTGGDNETERYTDYPFLD